MREVLILTAIAAILFAFFFFEFRSKKKRQSLLKEARERYQKAFLSKDFGQIQHAGTDLSQTRNVQRSDLEMLYKDALTLIRENPEAKSYALNLGRRMYSKGRKEGVPTVYDEAAIQNDITAAS